MPRHRRAPAARQPQLGRPRLGARARARTAGTPWAPSSSPARPGPGRSAPSPTSPASARCAAGTTSRTRWPPALRRSSSASRRARWRPRSRRFPGLPHRLEEIGRLGRTLFINDSKATNADSAATALAAFERDIFWILGGKPKQGGITSLEPFFPRIARAYLIGEASEEFAATLEGKVAFERCGTLDAARGRAPRAMPRRAARAEPVVLLSPACASYDQFRNFEVRGDAFRTLVAALPGIALRGGG